MKWIEKYFLCIVIFSSLSSCITYEGNKPGREYILKFVNEEGSPLKGVNVSCVDLVGKGTVSGAVANQLNTSANVSQEDGIVRMKHGNTPMSTTAIPLIYAWSTKLDVECTFKLSDVEIFKGRLGQISKEKVITVKAK